MIYDYKDGDALLALGIFLAGLRMLLGFDHLTSEKIKSVSGFLLGVLTALLYIQTISPDKGTSLPPEVVTPAYGHVLTAYRTKKAKKYGTFKERKAARLAGRQKKYESRAAKRLERAIARSSNRGKRVRETLATAERLQVYVKSIQGKTNPYLSDAANARVWRAQGIEEAVILDRFPPIVKVIGKKYMDWKLGPSPGGTPPGPIAGPGGALKGKGKAAAIAIGGVVVGAIADEVLEEGFQFMYEAFPKDLNSFTQKMSPAYTGKGIGVYFRNILIGLMTKDEYDSLRSTASRWVVERLRAA